MFKNYILIAFRNLLKRKLFSIINIGGLTIGITSCLLIYLYVQDELKYDRHFANAENIFRLYGNNFDGKEYIIGQPARFLPEIIENIPEVKSGIRIRSRTVKIKVDEQNSYENSFTYADSNIFNFFRLKLFEGDPGSVLSAPYQITVSRSKASLLFGNENPIGKSVNINNKFDFTITGVFEDFPKHSHMRFDWIASFSSFRKMDPQVLENWGVFGNHTYLELIPGSHYPSVGEKITELWIRNDKGIMSQITGSVIMKLQPLPEIYLHSSQLRGSTVGEYGNIYTVIGLTVISFLILFIACFNYVNMTTAQASSRMTEVGIRKTIGAGRSQLVYQFLSETILMVLIALIISFDLVILLIPKYENFIGKDFSVNLLKNPSLTAVLTGISLLTAFLAGAYPSLILSGFKPIDILKRSTSFVADQTSRIRRYFQANFRKILVIIQYCIGITLIIVAILVSRQINYIRNSDMGFNRDQILVLRNFYDFNMSENFLLFKEEFLKIPEVTKVSGGINVPTDGVWNYGRPEVSLKEPKRVPSTGYITCDYEYLDLLEAKFISGRNFSPQLATDSMAVIVNETFVKLLGDTDVLDKTIKDVWDGRDRRIVGVVQDLQYNSIHQPLIPCIFINRHLWLPYCNYILVKVKSGNISQTMEKIGAIWNKINPDWPIDYFFLDDNFNALYKKEFQVSKLLSAFTVIAVLLCSMGLFGLALFITQSRTKEIGIHKVNGALVRNILQMLTGNFMRLIFIAYLLACPIAYFIIVKWLESFAYKKETEWWVFVVAGILAFILTILTVGWQAYRTARQNPVKALRYE
jgi:putative ABC transport system permease protein